MIAIYLDQNYLSNIAKQRAGVAAPGGDTAQLDALLVELTSTDRAIVPFSQYHAFETMKYDNENVRPHLVKLIGQLSKGICFRHGLDLVRDEIEAVAKSIKSTSKTSAKYTGIGFDCWPDVLDMSAARAALAGVPERHIFERVVDWLRNHSNMAEQLEAARLQIMEAEAEARADQKRRNEPVPSMAQSIVIQVAAYLRTHEIRAIVDAVATTHSIPAPLLIDGIGRDNLRAVPSLSIPVYLRARKETQPEAQARPGDFMDSAHASLLSCADIGAFDRATAELLKPGASHCGKYIVGNARDLIDSLSRYASSGSLVGN